MEVYPTAERSTERLLKRMTQAARSRALLAREEARSPSEAGRHKTRTRLWFGLGRALKKQVCCCSPLRERRDPCAPAQGYGSDRQLFWTEAKRVLRLGL